MSGFYTLKVLVPAELCGEARAAKIRLGLA